MAKVRNLSDIQQEIAFTEFDFYHIDNQFVIILSLFRDCPYYNLERNTHEAECLRTT